MINLGWVEKMFRILGVGRKNSKILERINKILIIVGVEGESFINPWGAGGGGGGRNF